MKYGARRSPGAVAERPVAVVDDPTVDAVVVLQGEEPLRSKLLGKDHAVVIAEGVGVGLVGVAQERLEEERPLVVLMALVVLARPVEAAEIIQLPRLVGPVVPAGVEAAVDGPLVVNLVLRLEAGDRGRLAVEEGIGVRIEEVFRGHHVFVAARSQHVAEAEEPLVHGQIDVQLRHGQAIEPLVVVPTGIEAGRPLTKRRSSP